MKQGFREGVEYENARIEYIVRNLLSDAEKARKSCKSHSKGKKRAMGAKLALEEVLERI